MKTDMKTGKKNIVKNIIAVSFSISFLFFSSPSYAECVATDKLCVMNEILTTTQQIEDPAWQDKVLRELAKAYTHEGHEDKALKLITKIKKPDTKAMTIRGIGFAAADNKWRKKERYEELFKELTIEANKITHNPSLGIAYTYIAMAQAFAEDDEGATKTAKAIENESLRNKAFGESAEIQAERDDFAEAMKSIAEINSVSFRNKAYGTIAQIFTKKGKLKEAYTSANKIDNPYAKAQALQKIVNYGNKEETIKE